jgi:hypothetical protein
VATRAAQSEAPGGNALRDVPERPPRSAIKAFRPSSTAGAWGARQSHLAIVASVDLAIGSGTAGRGYTVGEPERVHITP